MKNTFLVALMSLLAYSAFSQVYLSKIYNDILILGPNNVAPHCDEIAKSYVADIEELYDVLIKEQEQLNSELANFEKIASPSKSQSFIASEQKADILQIEKELTILMQFKELWLKVVDQTPVKLELVDAIKSGQCAEISTNHGMYLHNDFMVTMDKDINKIKIVEHFSIEKMDSIPEWTTKIDENCASKDTNDCRVWCYLNKPGGDVMVDFTGDIYKLENSKIGQAFGFAKGQAHASRTLTMDLQGTTIDIINVVKSDTNMLLQLDGFSTIECR